MAVPPSSLLTQSSTEPKEADRVVELEAVEQRYRAVIDVLDGMCVTEVARRNGVSRQSVHTWLRRYAKEAWRHWPTRARSPRAAAPDGSGHRGAGDRAASRTSRDGDRERSAPARQRGIRAGAGSLVDLSHPGAPPPHRTDPTQARTLGLQALGAQPVHGAVADGRRRALPSRRRHRGQGRDRRRRSLTVLRLRRWWPGRRPAGVRSAAVGAADHGVPSRY